MNLRLTIQAVVIGSLSFHFVIAADCRIRANLFLTECKDASYQPSDQALQGNWLEASDKNLRPNYEVRSYEEFQSRIQNLRPGDILQVGNNYWQNKGQIVISGQGTRSQPITIRAKNTAGVVFEGYTNIAILGSYIRFEGFAFRGVFKAPFSGVRAIALGSAPNYCHHCLVDSVYMLGFDSDKDTDDAISTTQIVVQGQWNRISHSVFDGKKARGNMITVGGSSQFPDHTLIDQNYFGNRPRDPQGSNGYESIAIGVGASFSDSNAIIEKNLFYRVNGEGEMITIKGSGVIIRENTIRESGAAIAMRTSNHSIVEGNIFDGKKQPYIGGISLRGNGHVVVHNIFQTLNPTLEGKAKREAYPLSIRAGHSRYAEPADPHSKEAYKPVEGATIAFNSFAFNGGVTSKGFQGANWIVGDDLTHSLHFDTQPRGVLFAYNALLASGELSPAIVSMGSQVEYRGNGCQATIHSPLVCGGKVRAMQLNGLYLPQGPNGITVPNRDAYRDLAIPDPLLARLKFINLFAGKEIPLKYLSRTDVGGTKWSCPSPSPSQD